MQYEHNVWIYENAGCLLLNSKPISHTLTVRRELKKCLNCIHSIITTILSHIYAKTNDLCLFFAATAVN